MTSDHAGSSEPVFDSDVALLERLQDSVLEEAGASEEPSGRQVALRRLREELKAAGLQKTG